MILEIKIQSALIHQFPAQSRQLEVLYASRQAGARRDRHLDAVDADLAVVQNVKADRDQRKENAEEGLLNLQQEFQNVVVPAAAAAIPHGFRQMGSLVMNMIYIYV